MKLYIIMGKIYGYSEVCNDTLVPKRLYSLVQGRVRFSDTFPAVCGDAKEVQAACSAEIHSRPGVPGPRFSFRKKLSAMFREARFYFRVFLRRGENSFPPPSVLKTHLQPRLYPPVITQNHRHLLQGRDSGAVLVPQRSAAAGCLQ